MATVALGLVDQHLVCDHEKTQMTKFRKRHGVVCVVEQCAECGQHMGERTKADYDCDALPWFDEELRGGFQESEFDKWRAAYDEYLRTPQWHGIRKVVLKRDRYTCQACLSRKADQVHHVSYKLYNQLGQSAAFELVAICYRCHVKIHPHMAEAQHELNSTLHNPYLNGAQAVMHEQR